VLAFGTAIQAAELIGDELLLTRLAALLQGFRHAHKFAISLWTIHIGLSLA
jgi:hypothetical protein